MILAGIPSAIAWRLAKTAWPAIRPTLLHLAYCHPQHGLVGTCQPRNGRCTTCRRRTQP